MNQFREGKGEEHQDTLLSAIARWNNSILTEEGIDTYTFKAHSIRGATSMV